MNTESKITIEPGKKFRRQAGTYDSTSNSPRYGFEVLAADKSASYRVIDNSQIMGAPGRYFWVWDITNQSSMPVLITLTKNGKAIDAAD